RHRRSTDYLYRARTGRLQDERIQSSRGGGQSHPMGHPGPHDPDPSRPRAQPHITGAAAGCTDSLRLAPALRPDQLEALLEQLFELFDGAALQQHVPVRPWWLDFLRLGQVTLDQGAFHSIAAQPGAGDLGFVGEGDFELLAVVGAVPRDLTRRQVMVAVSLVAHGS